MSAPITVSYSLVNTLLGGGAITGKSVSEIFAAGSVFIYGYPSSETTPRPAPADANAAIPLNGDNGFLLAKIDGETTGNLVFLAATNGVMNKGVETWDGTVNPAAGGMNPGYAGDGGDLSDHPFKATFFRVVHSDTADQTVVDTSNDTGNPRIQGLITPQDSGAGVLSNTTLAQNSNQIIDQFRIALPLIAP